MTDDWFTPDLDLGDDHQLHWTVLSDSDAHHGAILRHKKADGDWCYGSISFDTPEAREHLKSQVAYWKVESMEPLSLFPSILCSCGDHGFIRKGKWVKT